MVVALRGCWGGGVGDGGEVRGWSQGGGKGVGRGRGRNGILEGRDSGGIVEGRCGGGWMDLQGWLYFGLGGNGNSVP